MACGPVSILLASVYALFLPPHDFFFRFHPPWIKGPLHLWLDSDYNYERADLVENRLHWFGDGQTISEKTLTADPAIHRSALLGKV